MFANYIKTTLRFLHRNKTFSIINIIGLSIGTLCCLYILLYVRDQYKYDKHHKNTADIYRVGSKLKKISDGEESMRSSVVAPIAPLLKKDFGEVLEYTRVVPMLGIDKHLLRYRDKAVFEKNAIYVDSVFFDMFNYQFVFGKPASALKEPYSIVLLQSVSEKIFGNEDPVGKTISLENVNGKQDFTVKAVVNESLGKSHLKADIFITMNSGNMGDYVLTTDSWTKNGYIDTYVKLSPGTAVASLEKKFPAFVEQYGGKQLKTSGFEQSLFLQPLTEIHTDNKLEGYKFSKPVSTTFLTILLVIAILIQVIACINFMNLSTARASKRAKEVGVRKVIGAGKKQLIQQFMGESFLISLTSVLIAIPLLIIVLPYLNDVTEANIQLSFLGDPVVWLLLATIALITGLLAGSYPAFYLSAFNAIKVIKGNFSNQVSATGIRKSLVVFQFVLSITLIIGIIIIYSQLNYLKNKDLGFERDQRLIFSFNTDAGMGHIPSFLNDVRQIAGVKELSNASKYLGSPLFYSNGFFLKGGNDADSRIAGFIISDEYFVKANGIKLIGGRDFLPTDSAKVLINASMMKKLNLTPQTAPGTLLYDNQDRVEEIVGVMNDFNYSSLHKEVDNFLVWMRKPKDNVWPTIIASTRTSNYKELLSKIEGAWKKNIPEEPFSYSFLDQKVQQQYESEISLSRIINLFTVIAILISCLGLFGLAAFSAQQRSKEIGVRKVLGASVTSVVRLLSNEFLKLVMIAFIISAPVAWLASEKWLEGFAYKVDISWWMFAIAAVVVMVIALLTVSFQAIRAGMSNPVDALKTE
ncbi:MAG TPA: FtsX-like permease family protein [Flavitalea sp.]|nr:FtsX-like permease family protein [Flavitalea sp.]